VRELDGHRAHGHGVTRDLGVAAHAARDAERALEAAREDGADRLGLGGQIPRRLDLAQDLRLAQAIESRPQATAKRWRAASSPS